MNHLLETAILLQKLKNGEYKPTKGAKFTINERGKIRHIATSNMIDKTINHLMCDEVLSPAITPYLIYDNGASQKIKVWHFTEKGLKCIYTNIIENIKVMRDIYC